MVLDSIKDTLCAHLHESFWRFKAEARRVLLNVLLQDEEQFAERRFAHRNRNHMVLDGRVYMYTGYATEEGETDFAVPLLL